jgi:hypothetical protein
VAAGTPPIVRAEGLTELVSDIVLVCSGGTPTPTGQPVPQANVTITLNNTSVTSRILAGPSPVRTNLTEALLLIDEPGAFSPPVPQLVCGTGGTVETASGSGACIITGTGNGTGVYSGTGARANIFQGQITASNQISWASIPLDPPGSGNRTLRFTNLRVNANAVGSTASGAVNLVASVAGTVFSGGDSAPLPITNSTPIVAFVQSGLAFQARTADDSSILSSPASLPACTQSMARIATLRFQEAYPSAFRPRTIASFVDANTSSPPVAQNVPGQTYSSESGFVNPAFPNDSLHGTLSAAGLADFGTRVRVQFTNIPSGVMIAVDVLNQGATSGLTARLITSETMAFGGFVPPPGSPVVTISGVGGTATAVWEILSANPTSVDTLDFGVYAFSSGTVPPATGVVTVQASLAPVSTVTTASASSPLPRFAGVSTAAGLFGPSAQSPCATITVTPTPSPLTFSFPAGATAGASGSLQMQASLAGFSAILSPYTFAGGNWLSATTGNAALPATVGISVNPIGLATGTYNGAFLVSGPGLSNSVTVPVTMIIGSNRPSTDRLYVGTMTLANFGTVTNLPLPDAPNEKYCNPVRLAPDMVAWAYVPTSQERFGDFSATPASSQLIDPLTNAPFPGGVIPASRLPNPFAWRIAASGPAAGERCTPAPTLPQFTISYYVTGRTTAADLLGLDRSSLVGTVYQIGDPFPPDQIVNVFSKAPVDLWINPPTPSNATDPSRWLQVRMPSSCCTTPTALTFSIQPVGLPPGFYAAIVNITPLGAIGPQVSVNIGVIVQAPPNWITINPPSLQFTYLPGVPQSKPFAVIAAQNRSYTLTPRVVSPRGVNWVAVTTTSGTPATGGTGTTTFNAILTDAAATLGPGSYLAVIDIVATTGLLSRASFVGREMGDSGVVCGGGLSSERLAITLDVGAPLTIASTPNFPLTKDPQTNYQILSIPYTDGKPLPSQADLMLVFSPVQNIGNSSLNSPLYDVQSMILSPDPVNEETSDWLGVTPKSSGLPATVFPVLNQAAVNTLGPCDYGGYITISNSGMGALVLVKLSVAPGGLSGQGGGSPANVTKVMSQIAAGNGWKTTIILVNTDSTNAANFRLAFHPGKDPGGQPISPDAPFNVTDPLNPQGPGQVQNRVYAGMIPPGGSLTLETKGSDAPFWQGWAELMAPDSVGGTAIFRENRDANFYSEGSVLLKEPAGPTFFLPFDNTNGLATTMAIANTSSSQAASVKVKLHTETGDVFSQSPVPIPLGISGHEAFALASRFPDSANRRGVAEFISDGAPLAALGLRFNGQSFTSFEILTPPGGMLQAAAHITDGGMGEDWKTSITLVNLDAQQPNKVTLTFHRQRTAAGQVLFLESGSVTSDGTYNVTLSPGGSATIATQGLTGIPRWDGWADIKSSTYLGGFAVFRQYENGGQSEGTVSFTPKGGERFVMPFGAITGLALVNASDQPATINATFRDLTGAAIASVPDGKKAVQLAPGDHIAFELHDSVNAPLGGMGLPAGGIADFTSNQGGLVGIGLRFTTIGTFTSLPVIVK